MATWLVTGGAGYIGAHVARRLLGSGRDVVIVDDLSTGHRSFVPSGLRLVQKRLQDLVADDLQDVDGVIHLAAYKFAGVSVEQPLEFYRNNVDTMLALLEAMVEARVWQLVYSGSCAVYGNPSVERVDEDTPTEPASPYGETKLIGEWLARDVAAVQPLRYTALRYFNVIGSGYEDVFDTSPHNLIPYLFRAIDAGERPTLNGADHPTPDGTCIRDYVHVSDIADAHVLAAQAIEAGKPILPAYNLGTGRGASVFEVVDTARRVIPATIEPRIGPRRVGDPARIVADASLAAEHLDWTPTHDLDDMVRDAWRAWRTSSDRASGVGG